MRKGVMFFSFRDTGEDTELSIFDVIGFWGETAKSFRNQLKESKGKRVRVLINSPGGDMMDGNTIYNMLKDDKRPVSVKVMGMAVSAASIIAMAGDEIEIAENGIMMIHNPWVGAVGDAEDHLKVATVLEKLKSGAVSVYSSRTGQDRETISKMMDNETWMTADEAIANGFADSKGEPLKAAAHFDFANFKYNPPAEMAVRLKLFTMSARPDVTPPAKEHRNMGDEVNGSTTAADEATKVRIKAAADQAVALERTRVSDIKAVFKPFGNQYDEVMNACIDGGLDLNASNKKLLDAISAKNVDVSPLGGQTFQPGEMTAEEKFKMGATEALCIRAGHQKNEYKNEYSGYSLMELTRAYLHSKGINTFGKDKMEVVRLAITHTSSDFPLILQDAANKSMLKGFDESEQTYQAWVNPGNLNDFKTAHRIGMGTFSSLQEVKPGHEITFGTFGETAETIALLSYAKRFSITRQAIINDDLQSFTKIPRIMGQTAARLLGDLAYGVLTGNPAMSDTLALFEAATHKNLVTSGAPPSVTTISAAKTAMRKQKFSSTSEDKGSNVRPAVWIGPVALEDLMLQLVNSEFDPSTSNDTRTPNTVRGTLQVVTDPRLDTASATAWYLSASPNTNDTVELATLDGVTTPRLEQQNGWSVDGVEYKVGIDAGAAPLAYQTLYKNNGQ